MRHQTHRPSWFVKLKHGAMPRRPTGDIPLDDDDLLDEMLAKELGWLHLRQYHWHFDWSVWSAIHQFGTWLQPRFIPIGFILVTMLMFTVLWLPLALLKLQLKLTLSTDMLALYWTTLSHTVSDGSPLATS
jgi:hypothetical protein